MVVIVIIGVCFLVIYLYYLICFWQWKKNYQPIYNKEKIPVMGHRGSPDLITENTLASFQKAINQGADGVEFDIRLSKDKQIMIFHDADLKRLSNQHEGVQDLSLSELQTVVLNKQEGQKEETYIPSLNDIVPLINKMKIINIEIKSEGLFKGHGILKRLIKFLNKHKIDDKCIVSSFNPLILMKLRLQRPETVIGFLYRRKTILRGWDNMVWMLRIQPENLHIHYSMINHWIVRWSRKKGMSINAYTINDKDIYNKLKPKIDAVFTDNIEYIK